MPDPSFEELLDDCCLAFPLARNTPLDDPEHVKFTAARAAVVAEYEETAKHLAFYEEKSARLVSRVVALETPNA